MDPYGNLTSLSEFSNGRRLRLISYMDPDIAFGLHASRPQGGGATFPGEIADLSIAFFIGVQRLSSGGPDSSVLRAEASAGDTFTLGWDADPGCLLCWGGDAFELSNDKSVLDDASQSPAARFTVDFVDGCWFALNNPDRDRVVDVSRFGTAERTPIIPFGWNGGDNQKWRAEAVG